MYLLLLFACSFHSETISVLLFFLPSSSALTLPLVYTIVYTKTHLFACMQHTAKTQDESKKKNGYRKRFDPFILLPSFLFVLLFLFPESDLLLWWNNERKWNGSWVHFDDDEMKTGGWVIAVNPPLGFAYAENSARVNLCNMWLSKHIIAHLLIDYDWNGMWNVKGTQKSIIQCIDAWNFGTSFFYGSSKK